MMDFKTKRIFLFFICIITIKISAENYHTWFDVIQKKYPDDLYLSAIGSGENLYSAQNDAQNNLSKVFETKINSKENYSEKTNEYISNEESFSEQLSENSKSIIIQTSQTVVNSKFGESFQDDNGYYQLIYINKKETLPIIADKINSYLENFTHYKKNYEKAQEILVRYSLLTNAIRSFKKIQELNNQKVILSKKKNNTPLPYVEVIKILENLRTVKNELIITVNFSKDCDAEFESVVNSFLTKRGFQIGKDGILKLYVKLNMKDLPNEQFSYKFIEWILELELVNNSDVSIISFIDTNKEGHFSYEDARSKAKKSIQNNSFPKFINRFEKHLKDLTSIE